MDIARWRFRVDPAPERDQPGRPLGKFTRPSALPDQAQTPNCQLTIMDFGGPLLVFEVIGLVGRVGADGKKYPNNVAMSFTWRREPSGRQILSEGLGQGRGPGGRHVKMVRRGTLRQLHRRRAQPQSGRPQRGHRRRVPVLRVLPTGNISYRLGQQVSGTTKPDVLGKHEEIAKSWDKVLETVKGAIGLDVSKGTYQLGRC